MHYNDSGWLFQEGKLCNIVRKITVDEIEDLLNLAEDEDRWITVVKEKVQERDCILSGDSGKAQSIDPIMDEIRMMNAGGTVVPYPFGYTLTFPSRRHLFRGERKRYPHTESTLSRKTHGLTARERELYHVVSNMRICQFHKLLWNLHVVPYWEAKISEVNYKALAQHYGFDTFLLDLTNDFRTALFFATCKCQNGRWLPLEQRDIEESESSRFGVIYHTPDWTIDFFQPQSALRLGMKFMSSKCDGSFVIDGGDLDGIAFQIGLQPFYRCHAQSGYVFPMKTERPLEENPLFEKILFPQSEELSQRVFQMMHEGQDVYPNEGIEEGLDVLHQIQTGTLFSEDDLLWAYEIDECDKSIFPSLSVLRSALLETRIDGRSIRFRTSEVDFHFSDSQLCVINSEYDDKDLIAPIGGLLHQKPEAKKYRQQRCLEIYGKLI